MNTEQKRNEAVPQSYSPHVLNIIWTWPTMTQVAKLRLQTNLVINLDPGRQWVNGVTRKWKPAYFNTFLTGPV